MLLVDTKKTRRQIRRRNVARPRAARQPAGRRSGTAVTELAVCLPILVLLVLATIEACTMIHLKKSLTVAAYEAGRTAMMPGATSTAVTSDCQQVLTDREVQGSVITLTPSIFENEPPETFLTISVSAPCEQNTLLGTWFYSGRSLTAEATYKKEF